MENLDLGSLFEQFLSQSWIIGIVGGLVLFLILSPFILLGQNNLSKKISRKRLAIWLGRSGTRPGWKRVISWISSLNDFLERSYSVSFSKLVLEFWRDGWGEARPLSLVMVISIVISSGFLIGRLINISLLLTVFLVVCLLLGLCFMTCSRAKTKRQLFWKQFPGLLDKLSDSLKAGLSFPQAIEFVIPNLPEPSASEMIRLADQLALGFTINQAMWNLYERRPSEELMFLVEGLILQRQVGGDIARMMRGLAEMINKRVELDAEIRTLTAQGRLSAIVIASLIPVSLGLLSFFPGYVDILFNSTIGNLVLILVAFMELLGAVIVIQLIKVKV